MLIKPQIQIFRRKRAWWVEKIFSHTKISLIFIILCFEGIEWGEVVLDENYVNNDLFSDIKLWISPDKAKTYVVNIKKIYRYVIKFRSVDQNCHRQ